MAHKSRRGSRNAIFQHFRGVEMHIFARNRRNRSKLIERRPGPTQIDPGGLVAYRIERTVPKNKIFMESTDLWTRGRSRGAKTLKEIEKCDFLVVQRCGNSYFR